MAIEEKNMSIAVAIGDTYNSEDWVKNGRLRTVILTCPVLADGKTATLTITDADGNNIYTSSTIGTGATTGTNAVNVERELYGTVTVTVTMNATQAAIRTFTIKLITETVAG